VTTAVTVYALLLSAVLLGAAALALFRAEAELVAVKAERDELEERGAQKTLSAIRQARLRELAEAEVDHIKTRLDESRHATDHLLASLGASMELLD